MHLRVRTLRALGVLIAFLAVGASAAAAPATAAIGPELVRFGEFGSGAGQFTMGEGRTSLAADPQTGHVFISDRDNNRIDEFTAWGEFVKAWGWGVRDGSPEPQTCTELSGCQMGLAGPGAGQLFAPGGIALDAAGNVYVYDSTTNPAASPPSRRVQKFTPAGEFVLMFGGEVNETTGAGICTAADLQAGDVCGGGKEGSGPGEFTFVVQPNAPRDNIDIGPDGLLYIADQGRIQSFDLDGVFQGELTFATIQASNPLFPTDVEAVTLSVDPSSGDFVVAFNEFGQASSLWRVRADGSVVSPAPLRSTFPSAPERLYTQAATTDPAGNIYAAVDLQGLFSGSPRWRPYIQQLSPVGDQIGDCCHTPPIESNGAVFFSALATNTVTAAGGVDLYVAHLDEILQQQFIEVRGPAPDKWPPPSVPPTVEAQQAKSVGEGSATLQAVINPNFWADTSYRLEYGIAPCEEGGCQAGAWQDLGTGIVKKPVRVGGILVSGLQPGTTYHYRFAAQSGGGGPVFGPDRTFTTFPAPAPPFGSCPNQALRGAAAAALADCRAYEMVSPLDKEGGDILVQGNIASDLARLDQASLSGEAITYSSYKSFGDSTSAPYTSQYLASRGAGGWSSRAISPPQESGVFNGGKLDSGYRAFSEDLESGWLVQESEPPLAPGAVPGYANLYRRDNAGGGTYTALSTAKPENADPQDYTIELQGHSADGSRTFFRARGKLTANASGGMGMQVYEASAAGLRLVSVLPSGVAAGTGVIGGPTVGSAKPGPSYNRHTNVAGAVSEDGRRVYWSDQAEKLYVRISGTKTAAVSAAAAEFSAASPDGGEALYSEGEALKLFDLASGESTTLVAAGVRGVLGASRDLGRAYFVSTAALAPGAQGGAFNLYLYEAGAPLAFVAALADADGGNANDLSSPFALSPFARLARVSEDGAVAVFMSRRALTGADNADVESGEADAQLFRYSAAQHQLLCISCNPTGAQPQGRELEVEGKGRGYWYAARIPGWEFQLHAPRVIAAGGGRVFFNSADRLLLADRNGAEDVYEWEAPGVGTCSTQAPGYFAANGGCLSLISSGGGVHDSEFVDASADGRDAFFLTGQSLVEWDPGQIDVYDAREGGGFPAPPQPPAACEGEACQGPTSLPSEPSLASKSFEGAGNARATEARRCRKGLVRRHGRCTKKPRHRRHAKHGHSKTAKKDKR